MEEKIDSLINNVNEIFVNEIYKYKHKFNKTGEEELFNDFIETYIRACKMMNNRLVDGLIIARSSFEVLTLLIGIHIDKKCAQEYFRANSYERYQERKKEDQKAEDYMSQSYLRKIIKTKCTNIENDMNEIYKFLSLYAHPTIYRNLLRNMEKEKMHISKVYFNGIMSIPLIALLLFNDLSILEKDKILDMVNLKQLIEVVVIKSELSKISKIKSSRIEKFMYKDINQEFYNKIKIQEKKEILKIKNKYNKNKEKIEEVYKKTANKLEYMEIYHQCSEILKGIK